MTFQEVYDEHFRFVWRSLRRLGVPEADVADAVQDVFLVVHRRLADFEGRSAVTTWLFGICMRVASDRRRLAHVRREAPEDAAVLDAIEAHGDAAGEAERHQAATLVDRLLDRLPLEQRAVFVLFELEGMPGDAIAKLLDVPLGTVHSRLRLARAAFRRALARMNAGASFRFVPKTGSGR